MNDTDTLIFFTMFILGMLSLLISLANTKKCSEFILLDLFTHSILCYKDTNAFKSSLVNIFLRVRNKDY